MCVNYFDGQMHFDGHYVQRKQNILNWSFILIFGHTTGLVAKWYSFPLCEWETRVQIPIPPHPPTHQKKKKETRERDLDGDMICCVILTFVCKAHVGTHGYFRCITIYLFF